MDLVISSVLLTLGMMMMSPVNHIYTDKINFVCRDGRLDNVIKRLILQYF
ncbi:hypothetical protein [Escherichia coli]|nr:hypothetical protein [Escherichia coli]